MLTDTYGLGSFDFYQTIRNSIPHLKHIVKRGRYDAGDNIEYYTFIFKDGSQLQLHVGYREDLEKVGL